MGRKGKKPKIKKLKDEDILGIKFEIEDDADDVFAEYLEKIPVLPKEVLSADSGDESLRAETAASKTSPESAQVEIDLHGFHLAEAIYRVDQKIGDLLVHGPRIIHLKIITGKGLHSGPLGSVLAREVHEHVKSQYRKNIIRIEESPAAVTLDGLPIRGHFTVVFKKTGKR